MVPAPRPTEPYVEYTLNDDGQIVKAKLYGFTEIPERMFYQWTALVEVDLTESPGLTKIGASAFAYCSNLELAALPAGLTSIGEAAFLLCANLALTALPEEIASIARTAFLGCTNLALTSLPTELIIIGDSAFQNCTALALSALPDGLTSIGANAFQNCVNITLTALPAGVTFIGGSAFSGCVGVSVELLPSSLTNVGSYAFQGCVAIIHVEIAASVDMRVFQNCTGLEKVWIRTTCHQLYSPSAGQSPFVGCSDDLEIYVEAASKPGGAYFNRSGVNGATEVTVTYGQTTKPW